MLRRFIHLGFVAALVALIAFSAAATARARPLELGRRFGFETEVGVIPSAGTFVPTAYAEPGNLLRAPVDGVIVEWSVFQAAGTFGLHVVELGADGRVGVISSTPPETVPELNGASFPTALPIKAGQALGLDVSANSRLGFVEMPGASYDYFSPPLVDGSVTAPLGVKPYEIQLTALLQRAPTITSVATDYGSIPAEETYIRGSELNNVRAVEFGGVPAQSFDAHDAGNFIIALPPKKSKPTTVNVVVRTIAGKSAVGPASRFHYVACRVPSLRHKTLRGAKIALRRARCGIGRVRPKPVPSDATVVAQSLPPGSLKPDFTEVSLRFR